MRTMMIFLKKEFLEGIKTYKSLILVIVFLILGMMNPLLAKFLPEIVNSSMPAGMDIKMPEPTATDSWVQFFSNIEQMGITVMVIVFTGIVSSELSKGTLINLLTKGLSRSAVIFSKYLNLVCNWTACLAIAGIVTWAYTVHFFPNDKVENLFTSIFLLWLFGLLLFAVLIFGSTLTEKTYFGILGVGLVFFIMIIFNMIKKLEKINPMALSTRNLEIIQGKISIDTISGNIIATCVLIVTFLALAIILFNRKRV